MLQKLPFNLKQEASKNKRFYRQIINEADTLTKSVDLIVEDYIFGITPLSWESNLHIYYLAQIHAIRDLETQIIIYPFLFNTMISEEFKKTVMNNNGEFACIRITQEKFKVLLKCKPIEYLNRYNNSSRNYSGELPSLNTMLEMCLAM